MRQKYDDLDEFDFDESVATRRMLIEMQREKARMASRRKHGPRDKEHWDDFDDDDDDYEDYEDYEDYDEDEFDSYSDVRTDR